MNAPQKDVIIIGAGPAGLTAGYELTRHNLRPTVIEQLDKVGGIARTEKYKGFSFDMGGHRFFTKSKVVHQFWQEFLGDDFLIRPRLSRIYYNNKFFYYPLKALNSLVGLGPWQGAMVGLSYIRWQIFPYKVEETFEQWVTNRFGRRLFRIFFKTYTEKVWGVSTANLKAEFAKQRIKDLSLKSALMSIFIKPKKTIVSLIEEFYYPRFGPGMLWDRVRQEIENREGVLYLNSPVTKIYREGNCITSVEIQREGKQEVIFGTDFISSMPLIELIQKLDYAPDEVIQAANNLAYRDFLTVCLIVKKKDLFPDNWIYVHSPEVKVGRIQNFKNWSQDMVPDAEKSSLGLEYFCNEGDELWSMPDADLIELGKNEIEQIGLAKYNEIEDGCVFRVPKAYPIYDSEYRTNLNIIREFLGHLENLQTIGRNGLHRYNNQDHSMVTGMLAVRNIALDEKNDLWSVNEDQLYMEEISAGEIDEADLSKELAHDLMKIFPRMDPIAFGLALGIVCGLFIFLVTLSILLKGNSEITQGLQLLDNFLPGYHVNGPGSLIGLLDGLFLGFIAGWAIAYFRNLVVYLSAMILDREIHFKAMKRFLDDF